MKGRTLRKEIPALIAALVIVAAVALSRRLNVSSAPKEPPQPTDVLWAMFDAARAGDLRGYMSCFTGDLHQRLQKTLSEMGESQFVACLQRTASEPKGWSVLESEMERGGGDAYKVPVEYVYADKNEVQNHYLRKEGGAWKIYAVDGAQRIKTLIPYGTEVFPLRQP